LSPDAAAERRDVQLLLRIGLGTGAVLMAAGLVAALVSGPMPGLLLQTGGLWHRDAALPVRLCAIGILVLAGTPAVRVIALIVLWVRERDWRYAAVAVTVAAVLTLAVALGSRG
jgi:uncharacterized membrane protein